MKAVIISLIFVISVFTGCANSMQEVLDKSVNYTKDAYSSIKKNFDDSDEKKYPDAEKVAIEYSMAAYMEDIAKMLDYESEIEIRRVARALRRESVENNEKIDKNLSDKDVILMQKRNERFFTQRGKYNEEFKIENISEKDGILIIVTKLYDSEKKGFFSSLAPDYLYKIYLKNINNKWQIIKMNSSRDEAAIFALVEYEYKMRTDPRVKFVTEYANEKVNEFIESDNGQQLKKDLTQGIRNHSDVKQMREKMANEDKFKENIRNQMLSSLSDEERKNLTEEKKAIMEKQINVLYNKMKNDPFLGN